MTNANIALTPLLPGSALHGAVLALLQGGQPATPEIRSAWMNLLSAIDIHLQERQGANIAQAQLDLGPVVGGTKIHPDASDKVVNPGGQMLLVTRLGAEFGLKEVNACPSE